MGKEIVYCGDCGKSLREDDFAKGKAQQVDHQPYCSECKPLPAGPSTQAQTSSKITALKVSTGRHAPPPAPPTRRRPSEADSSKTPLLVGAALIVAAVLILIVFALSSTGRPAVPEQLPAPAPHAGPPKPAPKPAPASPTPPNPDKAAAAIKDLEALAGASAPPIAVLQKCDEIRPLVQGTPHEARLKGIEERAREDRRVQQLEGSLEEVKKLRALDPGYERKEEIVRLLNATLPLSGSRRTEVEAALRSYQRDAQAYVPAAPLPAARAAASPNAGPAPAPSSAPAGSGRLGPSDTDAAGGVNQWLVLGPFATRNNRDVLYDHDLLRPELGHVPSPGLEVTTRESTKVRWTPAVTTGGKLEFAEVLSPNLKAGTPVIVFAACWVVAENDLEMKLRIHADLAYNLQIDGQKVRNQPGGHKLNEEEDIYRFKFSRGPHLLLFKLASPDGLPYLQLKLTQNSPDRAKGVKIWNQPLESRKVLYAQSFNDGVDGFIKGTLADGGIGGTKVLSITNSAVKERVLKSPITAETTIRFKVKLLSDARSFQVMMWSNKVNQNYWYHLRDLKKGEWTTIELKVADFRAGYKMDGPGPEGDLPVNLVFNVEPLPGSEGRALLDDLEILE